MALANNVGRTPDAPTKVPIVEHRSELTMSDAEVKTARKCGVIVLCLIIRCCAGKNVFCHVAPCKGDDEDKCVVNLAVEDIGWLGRTRVILKSDE